jgi:hypothetical protein
VRRTYESPPQDPVEPLRSKHWSSVKPEATRRIARNRATQRQCLRKSRQGLPVCPRSHAEPSYAQRENRRRRRRPFWRGHSTGLGGDQERLRIMEPI